MTQEPKITAALIYDFDGTLAPGNMQEYDFIPAVGQSNREFWNDANSLAEEQDADMTLTYMAKMLEAARSRKLSLRREAFQESGRNIRLFPGVKEWFGRINAYAAARGELPLGRVFADALAAGKTLVLPRCAGEGVMHGHRVDAPDRLVKGAYGILEPGADCLRVEPAEIDLIFVPGTAFDVRGHRIGQGGGYYDRYLNRTRAVRVGVCHDFALLSAVPSEAHDARMDIVVTPGRTVIIREETT